MSAPASDTMLLEQQRRQVVQTAAAIAMMFKQ